MRFNKTRPLMALAMLVAALALAVGISACGGGGSSSSSEASESTGAETTETTEESETEEEPAEQEELEAGTAIESNPANEKVSLTIGSKNFPEQEILGEVYAQALTAAGYKVQSDLSLGSETVALKTLKAGKISGYPEYASTALTAFFGLEPEEVPSSATQAWEKSNQEF